MAEDLSPPLYREPVVERDRLTMTALWQRWLDVLFRRQASVEARLVALEARVFALENPKMAETAVTLIAHSLTSLVAYLLAHGTYAEQLRAQAGLSASVALVAERVAAAPLPAGLAALSPARLEARAQWDQWAQARVAPASHEES